MTCKEHDCPCPIESTCGCCCTGDACECDRICPDCKCKMPCKGCGANHPKSTTDTSNLPSPT